MSFIHANTIPLKQGWNLISLGVQPVDSSVSEIFHNVPDMKYLMGFLRNPSDGGSEGFRTYMNIEGMRDFSTLTTMDGLHGYWVYMTGIDTLEVFGDKIDVQQQIMLSSGWNLVGYWLDQSYAMPTCETQTNTIIDSIFNPSPSIIGGTAKYIMGFYRDTGNGISEGFKTFMNNTAISFSNLPAIDPGKGYWVYMQDEGILEYNSKNPLDLTPPENITAFKVSGIDAAIPCVSLCWTNPEEDFYKVVIRRKEDSYPNDLADGTEIYNDNGSHTLDSTVSIGKKYCYRAWAYDSNENFALSTAITDALVIDTNFVDLGKSTLVLDTTEAVSVNYSPDNGGVSIPVAAPSAAELTVGSIIVAGTSETETGIARKVTSLRVEGEQVIAETTQAALDEVIENCDVSVVRPLNFSNAEFAPLRKGVKLVSPLHAPTKDGLYISLDNCVLYDYDKDTSTTFDQITVKGYISFKNPIYNGECKISWHGLDKFLVSLAFREDSEMKITSKIAGQLEWKKDLSEWFPFCKVRFPKIVAGPIEIGPVMTFYIGLQGKAYAGLSVSVVQQASMTGGLLYENGWSPIRQFSNTFYYTPPALFANADFKLYFGPQVDFNIYEVVGPYLMVDGFLKLVADTTPKMTLYGGLEADVGITAVKILGFKLTEPFKLTGAIKNQQKLWELLKPSTTSLMNYSNVSSTGFSLNWSKISNADSYRIYKDYKQYGVDTTGNSVSITGLSPKHIYTMQVSGINILGEGDKRSLIVPTSNPLTSITIAPAMISLYTGSSYYLNNNIVATTHYTDGSTFNVSSGITWKMSSGVGNLNGNIYIAGANAGSAVLTCSYIDCGLTKSANLSITVNKTKTFSNISINPSSASITAGGSYNLSNVNVTAHYSDNSTSTVNGVTWSLSSGVGSLIGTTYDSGSSAGNAILACSYNDGGVTKATDFSITVTKTLSSIRINPTSVSIFSNSFFLLSNINITADYADSSTATISNGAWSLSSGVGSISGKTYYPGANTGSGVLTYSYTENGVTKTASITVTVNKILSSISLNTNEIHIIADGTFELSSISASAHYSDSSNVPVDSVSCVMGSGLGQIEGNVYLAGPNAGSAVLIFSYTENGVTKTANLKIIINKRLLSISIKPLSVELTSISFYNLSNVIVTARYSDSSTSTVNGPAWRIISGVGSLSGTTYSAGSSVGNAVLTCSYNEGGVTKTADLSISIFNDSIDTIDKAITDIQNAILNKGSTLFASRISSTAAVDGWGKTSLTTAFSAYVAGSAILNDSIIPSVTSLSMVPQNIVYNADMNEATLEVDVNFTWTRTRSSFYNKNGGAYTNVSEPYHVTWPVHFAKISGIWQFTNCELVQFIRMKNSLINFMDPPHNNISFSIYEDTNHPINSFSVRKDNAPFTFDGTWEWTTNASRKVKEGYKYYATLEAGTYAFDIAYMDGKTASYSRVIKTTFQEPKVTAIVNGQVVTITWNDNAAVANSNDNYKISVVTDGHTYNARGLSRTTNSVVFTLPSLSNYISIQFRIQDPFWNILFDTQFYPKSLTSINLNPGSIEVSVNNTYDLKNEIVTANYLDTMLQSSSRTVSNVSWSMPNGVGNLNGSTYNAGSSVGNAVLNCSYTEGGVRKNTDLPITVTNPLSSITISMTSETLYTGTSYNLSIVIVTAHYSDGSTSTVNGATWSINSGLGSLIGTTYNAGSSAGSAVLICSYNEGRLIKTAAFSVNVIPQKTLTNVIISPSNITLSAGGTYSLKKEYITALYSDTSTAEITSEIWSVSSGHGTIENDIYTASSDTGSAALTASYSESGVTKTADFNISIVSSPIVNWYQATDNVPWNGREGNTTLVFYDKMWIIGGADWEGSNTLFNDVWYSSDGVSWTQANANSAWSARCGHTSLVFNNKMWVLGGWDGTQKNDVWSSTDGVNWVQVTANAAWCARSGHTSLVFDNKMWIIGGNYYDQTLPDNNKKNDVWYSSDGITWTQATAHAGWSERFFHSSVVFDNKMWVIGGGNNSVGWPIYNDVWYSTDGANWTLAAANAGWGIRSSHSSVVFDNKMWVIGGYSINNICNDVWYSTDGVDWFPTNSSRIWTPRGGTSIVFNNKMWIMGGKNSVWSYDKDVWYSDGHNTGETMTLNLTGEVTMDFVWVPSGSFTMGSPDSETGRTTSEVQHTVNITKGFWLGKYEVTQSQWQAVTGRNPSHFSGYPNRPVEEVSWNDCQSFITSLNGKGIGTFRLPNEAEWEYACRAGSTSAYYWGTNPDEKYMWYNSTSGSTHDVGGKLPNTWGLYDMSGNVWEWCNDRYGMYNSSIQNDPQGPSTGSYFVSRGGSFYHADYYSRSAYRGNYVSTYYNDFLGLRIVLTPAGL
ncbi:MAG: SUMF1/EgtB/PvdO family nonheme iron enzyme [Candidatus Wallbacteria bacterium]|nr:SUMF1/EgtB/PvdO family nonheme iron enzyme [Candidatus Wallbacteria bacterium]